MACRAKDKKLPHPSTEEEAKGLQWHEAMRVGTRRIRVFASMRDSQAVMSRSALLWLLPFVQQSRPVNMGLSPVKPWLLPRNCSQGLYCFCGMAANLLYYAWLVNRRPHLWRPACETSCSPAVNLMPLMWVLQHHNRWPG